MEKVLLFMTDGTEECEALITLDILRRANINIETVAVKEKTKEIISSHNIKLFCDKNIEDIKNEVADCYIIPGGALGVENLYNNTLFIDLIKKAYDNNKLIAAICAAPSILGKLGILKDLNEATCYPGFEDSFSDIYKFKKLCCEKNIITGRSLGSSFEFSFEILKRLKNEEVMKKIKNSIHFDMQ